jgi:DNA-binding winged helix-turn-helix (wHTH) protein
LLKICGSVFSDDSVDNLRDALTEVGDEIADVDEDGFKFDVEIDRDDYVVEEPAVIVDPVAVYW